MDRLILLVMLLPNILGIVVNDPPEGIAYKYSYNIEDPTTGDTKSQQETRNGNTVTGSYSVLDPDGIKRTVTYTADSRHGFQAIIHRLPTKPSYEPTAPVYDDEYAQYVRIPQSLYTSIPAPTSFETYLPKGPDSVPYYTTLKRVVEVGQQEYFRPTQDRKTILRDSLGPGQYFEPSPGYHQ